MNSHDATTSTVVYRRVRVFPFVDLYSRVSAIVCSRRKGRITYNTPSRGDHVIFGLVVCECNEAVGAARSAITFSDAMGTEKQVLLVGCFGNLDARTVEIFPKPNVQLCEAAQLQLGHALFCAPSVTTRTCLVLRSRRVHGELPLEPIQLQLRGVAARAW